MVQGRGRRRDSSDYGQGHRNKARHRDFDHNPRFKTYAGQRHRECGRSTQRACMMKDPEEGILWNCQGHRDEDLDLKVEISGKVANPYRGNGKSRFWWRQREEIESEVGHRRYMQRAWKVKDPKEGILWRGSEAGKRHRDLWTDAGKCRRFKATYAGNRRQRQRDTAEKHRASMQTDACRFMVSSQDRAGWTHAEHSKAQLRRAGSGWSKHRPSSVGQGKSGSAVAPKESGWHKVKEQEQSEEVGVWSKMVRGGSCGSEKEGDWGWHLKMQSESTSSSTVQRVICYEEGSTTTTEEGCLPFHLIAEHILRRLSLRQRCQLRCVCKAWNSWLTWDDPLKTEEEAEYWFLLFQPAREEPMVCSSQGCCHLLPLRRPILPRIFQYLTVNIEFGLSYLLASAGGLMCAVVPSGGDAIEVLVFNCLTGAVKALPRNPILDSCPFLFLYFAVDSEDPCRYYVLLSRLPLSLAPCDLEHFEVFDSRTGIWKVGRRHSAATTESSWLDGDFFNVGTHISGDILRLQAYHVAQDAWSSTVQVSLGSSDLEGSYFCTSLKYKGRLFLCFSHGNESSFGLRVLKMESTGTYVEVARTPEHLFQPWDNLTRVEAEGHLFYTVCVEASCARCSTLVYDIALDSWCVLPYPDESILLTAYRPTLSMCLA